MEEMSFSNVIKNIKVDDAALARDMTIAPADRSYVIFFTPRSGSSWLTSVLSATKELGFPEEYINPAFVGDVVKVTNARAPRLLMKMLKRKCKTSNGVFGMEVRSNDVILFGELEFFAEIDTTTIIYFLWRENIVAQGISLYRAVTTGRYHSSDEAAISVPPYSADGIKYWVLHVANIEDDNLMMLRRHGLAPRFLCYEDIVRDRVATLALFAEPLGVQLEPTELRQPPEELAKIADTWNGDTEERFRREEAEYISSIEQQRLILREPEMVPRR